MKQFFIYLQIQFRRFFPSKIDKMNRKLHKALVDVSAERKGVRLAVDAYMVKHYHIGCLSAFIPRKGISKLKVYNDIQKQFGEQMRACNLRLTRSLVWK